MPERIGQAEANVVKVGGAHVQVDEQEYAEGHAKNGQ